MNKILFFVTSLVSLIAKTQTGPSFTITNATGSNSITCSHSSVTLLVSGASYLTYSWLSSISASSGPSLTVTSPGTFTVTAFDTLNNSSSQIVTIGINTVAPLSTISPSVQSISCTSSTAQFVIVVSPTPTTPLSPPLNLTHSISSQYGGPFISNAGSSFIYQTNAPGTYTYLLIDNNNGCTSTKHFTVNSVSAFPTHILSSPQNFTLGCSSKSFAIINITNAATTPTPGGPLTYTLIGPPTSTVVPSGSLSTLSTYSLTVPGTWTAIVKDNNNGCETRTPFSIIQNTTTPNLNVSVPKQILDCNTPMVYLKATSSVSNVSFFWAFQGVPLNPYDSLAVQVNTATFNNTLINTYTITATENNNLCKSFTVIPMFQNIFPPKAKISSGTSTAITCASPSVVLTNISTTGIPPSTGFPTSSPVIANLWSGPTVSVNVSTYVAYVAGTYTLEAKDLNNGCKSQTTITIADNQVYPIINMPSSYFLPCPGTVILSAMVISSAACTYSWSAPLNSTISLGTSANLSVNSPGYYSVVATNTMNGCASSATTVVQACVGISSNVDPETDIKIFPNPNNGVFTITSDNPMLNTKIEIYNILGVLVERESFDSDKKYIDVQSQPKGIYIVQISENNKIVYISKFIKQ